MPNQPPHNQEHTAAPSRDELRNELTRRGLPQAYIERLLSELDDHFADLLAERSSAMSAARKLQFEESNAISESSPSGSGQGEGALATSPSATYAQQRLGEPTHLALFAAEQYHNRSFWGRHPLITYLVGPLPLYVGMWLLYLLAVTIPIYCIGTICERMGWWTQADLAASAANHLIAQSIVLATFAWGLLVLPPIGAALALCRVYRRNALDWRWPALGCALLAAVVAVVQVSWRLSTGPGMTEHGQLILGFSFSGSTRAILLDFLPKFALALGIGLLLIKRAQHQRDALAT